MTSGTVESMPTAGAMSLSYRLASLHLEGRAAGLAARGQDRGKTAPPAPPLPSEVPRVDARSAVGRRRRVARPRPVFKRGLGQLDIG